MRRLFVALFLRLFFAVKRTYVIVLRMKWALLVLGLLLVVAGVAGLAHPAITYRQKDEVAKIGPIQATVEKEKTAQIPTILSLVGVGGGLALVVLSARRRS